jgi:hypothetical protein
MKNWDVASMEDIKKEFQRGYHWGGDWDPDAFPRAYNLIEQLETENVLLKNLVAAYDDYFTSSKNSYYENVRVSKRVQENREKLAEFKKGESHEIYFN